MQTATAGGGLLSIEIRRLGVPAINTRDLEQLLIQRKYERIVLTRNHGLYYMLIQVADGPTLIHYNKNGRPKRVSPRLAGQGMVGA